MRTTPALLAALAAATFLNSGSGGAGEYPWCAQLFEGGGGDAGRICGYVTWGQCRATTGLQDGFCLPNPAYGMVIDEPGSPHRSPRRPR
jgi:Protein of unknown function (DUF3551)